MKTKDKPMFQLNNCTFAEKLTAARTPKIKKGQAAMFFFLNWGLVN